jgi:hypothetical protein
MNIRIQKDRRVPLGWTKSIFLNWLCAVAALLVITGCESTKPASVPPELLGTWRTTDARYEGLFFRIDPMSFAFSTVEGNVENYSIVKYEKSDAQQQRSDSTHVLHGSRDGQKLQVRLLYESFGGGRFRFKNQDKTFWTRDDNQRQ